MTTSQQIIIAMCAGEASGDLLGAHLIEALKRQYPNARFVGIGGPRMQAEGFESLFEQERLAVRGYFEVLSNLPEILGIRSSLIEELIFIRPQVFVGIDAPNFNLYVAEKLKAAGIPTLHYVSPSVWAWKAGRVHKIVKQVNRVLCLFPMEPKLYEDAGGRALFVGHPLAQMLPINPDRQGAREVLKLDDSIPVITIMPGSRVSEIEYMAPLFFQTAKLLLRDLPNAQFIVPYPTNVIREMLQDLLSKEWFRHLPIRLQAAKTELACAAADVVLVTSGTATLEVALCKRPMVISYKISPMTYALVKHKIKVPYVGLPNILLGKKVVPELLQNDATGENLAQAVLNWYRQPDEVAKLEMSFIRLHKMLLKNTDELVAHAVLEEAGLLPESMQIESLQTIEVAPSSSEQQFTLPENDTFTSTEPHFAEVGVVGEDGKTYADHSQIPSVTHTLAQQSADMFQEVDDQHPIVPSKKQGFLARLFGKKQAAESENYAATPRLHQDEFDTLPEKEKKPKAVQSSDNPNRYVLDLDDLPDASVDSESETVTIATRHAKRQPNIFDKYRQQDTPTTTSSTTASEVVAPKENIFSKYMNQDGTVKERQDSVIKKEPNTKSNIFDKYRNQASSAQNTIAQTHSTADEDMESAIAESFLEHHEPELPPTLGSVPKRVQAAQSGHVRPNIFARHQSKLADNARRMDTSTTLVEKNTASPSVSSSETGHVAKQARPNIFARHREKHGAPPPKKEVDLNDILGEVRNETVIAIPVADDMVIPEISLNVNHEDFVVITDPTTHKPTLLSKEEWAMQQQAAQTALENEHSGTLPVGVVDVVPSAAAVVPELEMGQRVERILKPQRARPNEATQPILPKTSMAYKYAMMFQNTSDVRLEREHMPTEDSQPENVASSIEALASEMPSAEKMDALLGSALAQLMAEKGEFVENASDALVIPEMPVTPQVEVTPQPETVAVSQVEVAVQPELVVVPQVEVVPQPETVVAPQIEVAAQPELVVAPQIEVAAQPELVVAPQIEVAAQPELVVAPQVEVAAQPELVVAPQIEVVPQPELVVPQVEVAAQPETVVAPQVEVTPQPELVVAPQIEVVPQPELVVPQVEVATQPELVVTPQVEVTPQPELVVVPQVEVVPQPEMVVAPQIEVAAQPELVVAPQIEVVPQPELVVAPQVEVAAQPESIVLSESLKFNMPTAEEIDAWLSHALVSLTAESEHASDLLVAPQPELVVVPQVEIAPQPETVLAPQIEVALQPETVTPTETTEPVFQHSPRFSQRYPAKAGYTATNQKLFF